MSKIIISEQNQQVTNATQDTLNEKYRREIGHDAVVERETVENDQLTVQLREVLEDIGKNILEYSPQIPKGMQYLGSLAVHMYRAPTVGMVAYYSQLAIAGCPEQIVGPAITDLRNACLKEFGHRAQRKRSGF